MNDRQITIREVAYDVDISFGSCQEIFSDVLAIKHEQNLFKLLNFKQKLRRVEIAQELLNELNIDPEFF